MKIAVRALVLGMLITGFAADHYMSAKTTSSQKVMIASNSAAPMPMCPPSDPNGCNIAK
ncbi:MAG TPA: hypothetical protein VHX63_07145 [Acidobacteriaceae bacterium]|jgi:hypothetical protein|nr:hypothetical protein [Acidobacteriaceae bacterium]